MIATGYTSKSGLNLSLTVLPTTRINAMPGALPGDIVVTLGDGVGGADLMLIMRLREADRLMDQLVDAISTYREAEIAKYNQGGFDANDAGHLG